jgi:hypothetical protein
MALEREIARDLRSVGAAVVIRVGGASRFRVELHLPTGRLDGATDTADVLRTLLAAVPRLGSSIPAASAILSLTNCPASFCGCAATCCAIGWRRGCMTSSRSRPPIACWARDGCYRGPVRGPSPDPAHRYTRPRAATSTSGSGSALACPAVGLRRDHGLRPKQRESSARPSRTCLTACVSARHSLSPCRNASRIPGDRPGCAGQPQRAERRARDPSARPPLSAHRRPRGIVVIGNVDASISLPARVRIHGGYDATRIAELARRYGIVHGSCPRSGPRPIPSPRGRRWPPACRSSPSTSAHRARRCAPRPMERDRAP